MENFSYSIPTQVYFGKGQLSHLTELRDYGSRVLLCYGGGSIKRSGLYDHVKALLAEAGLACCELSGIEPNPRIESVREGVRLCIEEEVDLVLAVGGGSVIDCAKVIAAGACYAGDPWDLVLDGSKIEVALPIASVLTLAATGSEMDGFAVISDLGKKEKWGTGSEWLKPCLSILDPTYTFSVSQKQTAAGTADIMSHIFENYFTNVKGAYVQARFCESLLRTCITYGPIALQRPEDYEARANLMWTSSLAINGLLSYGADVAWCVHPMEHELSAFYDITHGEGLAILTPVWMEYVLSADTAEKFAEYGCNVWGISREKDSMTIAKEAIQCTRNFFFKTMKLPRSLREVGIGEENFVAMAKKAAQNLQDAYCPLTAADVEKIYRAAL